MTVREMYYKKYCATLKQINKAKWEMIMRQSDEKRMHPAEIMYLFYIEITVDDIRLNGGYNGELWREIKELHSKKMMASNAHRQYSGHKTAYWLTIKGFNHFNKSHEIC